MNYLTPKRLAHAAMTAFALAGLAAAGPAANAQVFCWTSGAGANNHCYEWVQTALSWTDARTAATLRTNAGQPGYLVTITSAEEQAFLDANFGGLDGWLGFTDEVTEGTFVWVTGEAVTYTRWNGGEPNNLGDEDYTQMGGSHFWNDLPNGSARPYFVEYNPASTAVPEPGALSLLAGSAVGAGLLLRRRRK
jgi:hypothetical protein